ncbi:hypothetical protein L6164_003380 [Bauhinia variegata]|uniref:Uncharacterized protein n=1 Tax=Bauhinia variegata TaxID=167791 RepID=A0ACB9Q3E7_BAUVA|nr:hypothetical protein L6164_003380 [Bauhinia variegata]
MKLDEDLGRRDCDETFLMDDEESQAVVEHLDDDTDSDSASSFSRKLSSNVDAAWPQSYRQSMDMLTSVTPSPFSFSWKTGSMGASGFLSTAFKRAPIGQSESASLINPLIPNTNSIKQEEPTLVQQRFSSCSKFSHSELPPARQQCSFAQSVLNGINMLCGLGLLSMPYAVKEGGWLSLTMLLMFAIMCCYTGVLMRRCLESSPGLETYPDIGYAAFGSVGRLVITGSIIGFMGCLTY